MPVRRAAAVVSLLMLVALAGCGEEAGRDEADRDEVETAGALTRDQLESALLEPGSAVGGWTVDARDDAHTEPVDRAAQPERCSALAVLPLDDIEAAAWAELSLSRKVPGLLLGDRVDFGVMTLGGDGAERTFDAFLAAAAECSEGFLLELPLNEVQVDRVVTTRGPGLGDESATVGLHAATVLEGMEDCRSSLTLIRQGRELIAYDGGFFCQTSAYVGEGVETRATPALPRRALVAQLERLASARS